MSEPTRCPDCDGIKVNPFVDEGDGRCSACHGDGAGGVLDHVADAANVFTSEKSSCWKCAGSGQCQQCGGTGVIYR